MDRPRLLGFLLAGSACLAIVGYASVMLPSSMEDSPAILAEIAQQPQSFEQSSGRWMVSGWPKGQDGQDASCSVSSRDDGGNAFAWRTGLRLNGARGPSTLLLPGEHGQSQARSVTLLFDGLPPDRQPAALNALGTLSVVYGDGNKFLDTALHSLRLRVLMDGQEVMNADLSGFDAATKVQSTCLKRMSGKISHISQPPNPR